jgi:hypothetical protein
MFLEPLVFLKAGAATGQSQRAHKPRNVWCAVLCSRTEPLWSNFKRATATYTFSVLDTPHPHVFQLVRTYPLSCIVRLSGLHV